MNCRTPGQKYGALEIRVKRFSSPMRRGGGFRNPPPLLMGGHGTGAGPRCLEGGFAQDFAGFAGGFAVVSQVSQ